MFLGVPSGIGSKPVLPGSIPRPTTGTTRSSKRISIPDTDLAKLCSIGAGGAGVHGDRNTVVPGHFAVSTIVLRARGEGLLHVRDDVEKTFFIHGGEIRHMLEKDDEKYETIF